MIPWSNKREVCKKMSRHRPVLSRPMICEHNVTTRENGCIRRDELYLSKLLGEHWIFLEFQINVLPADDFIGI